MMNFEEFKKRLLKEYKIIQHISPPSNERILELYLTQVVISKFEHDEFRKNNIRMGRT